MVYVGKDISEAIVRVPLSARRHVFQIALNLLETSWSSIQIVALSAPDNPSCPVSIPGGEIKAPLISPECRRKQILANKMIANRDLIAWILEEKISCQV
tara:strand:- start:7441 stop:7737 length:297 start_codon:yes stop_codon:yes gene_type:complete